MCSPFFLISQDITGQLQNKSWQTTKSLTDKQDKPVILKLKKDTAPDIEVVFLKSNKLQLTFINKDNAVDAQGNLVPPGSKHTVSPYTYSIKGDLIKLSSTWLVAKTNKSYTDIHCYKIISVKNEDSFEFIPISADQFK